MIMKRSLLYLAGMLVACTGHMANPSSVSKSLRFSVPVKVTVTGYQQDVMEPFLTKDGAYLFFNNLNDPAVTNTNIYYAAYLNDSAFSYMGEIGNVNSPALDAVASMDTSGDFYFISTRSYDQTLSTVYTGSFSGGVVSSPRILPGISDERPGIVEFDMEVSASGRTIYFSDGRFNGAGVLQSSDLVIAEKDDTGFHQIAGSSVILQNINTAQLEYAACLSADELTLYFTRVSSVSGSAGPKIWYATRDAKTSPFDVARQITELDGFVEAPTLSADGKMLYYHRKEGNHFALYFTRVSS